MQALAMGGYGGYVWGAFGFTLISMIGLLWQSWRAQRRRADELAALRSTVRSGGRRDSDTTDGAPPRRLVATRPTISQSLATPPAEPGPHGFAASGPSTGT